VGVAAFREGKPSHLDLVAVAQAFGHQGIGEKLTNRVLGRLVEAGHVPVVCEIACLEDYMERILSKTPYAAHVQVV
jgi:ribosomal protein S18 acetylase RimI-like enzyme